MNKFTTFLAVALALGLVLIPGAKKASAYHHSDEYTKRYIPERYWGGGGIYDRYQWQDQIRHKYKTRDHKDWRYYHHSEDSKRSYPYGRDRGSDLNHYRWHGQYRQKATGDYDRPHYGGHYNLYKKYSEIMNDRPRYEHKYSGPYGAVSDHGYHAYRDHRQRTDRHYQGLEGLRIDRDHWTGRFNVLDSRDGILRFQVPTNLRQLDQEKIDARDLRLNASIALRDRASKDWRLMTEKNYSIPTRLEGGNLIGEIDIRQFKDHLVYPRIWINDSRTDKWGWIDQSSRYSRDNFDGNPSYEFIYDPHRGEVFTPSDKLPVRP
jgi:hypothetical protein